MQLHKPYHLGVPKVGGINSCAQPLLSRGEKESIQIHPLPSPAPQSGKGRPVTRVGFLSGGCKTGSLKIWILNPQKVSL